ncbi:MAG: ATP-binding cassette domain-containing protein [Aquificota bacterium]|nr:MAG: ATP-binding cassette domain-containing protein [Aquificota bacterium]
MIKIDIEKKLTSHNGEIVLSISTQIKEKEFITVFGESGAGKTTFLRIIAGLTVPDRGFIEVNGDVWFDSERGINLPPQKRKIGFVFQDYALFPNMTVEENILFAMEKKDISFLEELLEIVDLKGLRKRKPDSLSGGQKQRVALARAIARKPEILLLDEPLSALDIKTRQVLQEEIKKIHEKFNLTTFLVSHDYSEIFKMSNRVLYLKNGIVFKEGTPEEVFIEKRISGKVKITGEVLKIKKEDIVFVLSIFAGSSIIRVVATEEEAKEIKVGDKVLIAVKAFNPVIFKL